MEQINNKDLPIKRTLGMFVGFHNLLGIIIPPKIKIGQHFFLYLKECNHNHICHHNLVRYITSNLCPYQNLNQTNSCDLLVW